MDNILSFNAARDTKDKLKTVKQAAELYLLGMEVEAERLKTQEYADLYGLSAPNTVEQSSKTSARAISYNEFEQLIKAAITRLKERQSEM